MSSPQGENTAAADLHLRRLHKGCEITLERYTAIADDTCKLLGRLRSLPVSKDKKLEIFLQKRKEDEAHDAYQKARQSLLQAIERNPDIVEQVTDVEPVPPQRTPRTGNYRRRSG